MTAATGPNLVGLGARDTYQQSLPLRGGADSRDEFVAMNTAMTPTSDDGGTMASVGPLSSTKHSMCTGGGTIADYLQ